MPNDAKLGLVAGVGLVLAIAVVYFRKEPTEGPQQADGSATIAVGSSEATPGTLTASSSSVRGRPGQPAVVTSQRRHTVAEGETLSDLAKRFYGDPDKADQILQANANVFSSPDRLTPGIVLVIPDLP